MVSAWSIKIRSSLELAWVFFFLLYILTSRFLAISSNTSLILVFYLADVSKKNRVPISYISFNPSSFITTLSSPRSHWVPTKILIASLESVELLNSFAHFFTLSNDLLLYYLTIYSVME